MSHLLFSELPAKRIKFSAGIEHLCRGGRQCLAGIGARIAEQQHRLHGALRPIFLWQRRAQRGVRRE
ncbi:hypothetical protein E05_05110 [Plautia stali symbiont]|nr:hypothetical protein E05_05110 [Plautia stali symbiont]